MNHKVVVRAVPCFCQSRLLRPSFNTRGVGRSQGRFDNGMGELSDAAAALDWLQTMNADAKTCWIAGLLVRRLIGMQLLDAPPGSTVYLRWRRRLIPMISPSSPRPSSGS